MQRVCKYVSIHPPIQRQLERARDAPAVPLSLKPTRWGKVGKFVAELAKDGALVTWAADKVYVVLLGNNWNFLRPHFDTFDSKDRMFVYFCIFSNAWANIWSSF